MDTPEAVPLATQHEWQHATKIVHKILLRSAAGFHFSAAQPCLTPWMQLHDPTNTLTTRAASAGCQRIELCAPRDGGRAASANAKNEFTSDF